MLIKRQEFFIQKSYHATEGDIFLYEPSPSNAPKCELPRVVYRKDKNQEEPPRLLRIRAADKKPENCDAAGALRSPTAEKAGML
jgi:hypothetical protein